MTGRRIAVAAACLVAVVGIAARPLLGETRTAPPRRLPPPPAAPAEVSTVAARSAVAALACHPARPSRADTRATMRPSWCGRYTPNRIQSFCPTSDACTVEMIGALTTSVAAAPVALTVSVQRRISGWQVTAVRS